MLESSCRLSGVFRGCGLAVCVARALCVRLSLRSFFPQIHHPFFTPNIQLQACIACNSCIACIAHRRTDPLLVEQGCPVGVQTLPIMSLPKKRYVIELSTGLYAGCDWMDYALGRIESPVVAAGHITGPNTPGMVCNSPRTPWRAAYFPTAKAAQKCCDWLGEDGRKLRAKVWELSYALTLVAA